KYFIDVLDLTKSVAGDLHSWLVRRFREISAELRENRVSAEENARLRRELEVVRSKLREPPPEGSAVDLLERDTERWFRACQYDVEPHEIRDEQHFERILKIKERRGVTRAGEVLSLLEKGLGCSFALLAINEDRYWAGLCEGAPRWREYRHPSGHARS